MTSSPKKIPTYEEKRAAAEDEFERSTKAIEEEKSKKQQVEIKKELKTQCQSILDELMAYVATQITKKGLYQHITPSGAYVKDLIDSIDADIAKASKDPSQKATFFSVKMKKILTDAAEEVERIVRKEPQDKKNFDKDESLRLKVLPICMGKWTSISKTKKY